ncbi:hypothetical protein C4546_02425 [Candidatus Parcubacteria bacterium]|jgi:hypothetical protein|nr:MAG: hypothetical protein C4546_02425 [Candidatus Parcubacteria bacterium]
MRKKFFGALIILSLFLLAQPASAANLPQILPDCDRTMYKIQEKIIGSNVPRALTIYAEQYGTEEYPESQWDVTGYTTNVNCGFNDFLQLFINLFSWGLYILSALAVFFFFLGGGTLLLSGGNEERVRVGKMILTNTLVGLFVALGSWLIVNVAVIALTGQQSNGIGFIVQNQPWFKTDPSASYPDCNDPPEYPCKDRAGRNTVIQAQTALLYAGCYIDPKPGNGEIDGSFGPKTLQALHNLQIANGQPQTNSLAGIDFNNFPVTCTQFQQGLPTNLP